MLPEARGILAQKCAEGRRLPWLPCLAKTFAVLCGIEGGGCRCSAISYSSRFPTLIKLLLSTLQAELQTSPFFHGMLDLLCFSWIFQVLFSCGSVFLPSTI